MYSPKIEDELIQKLYWIAKNKGISMKKLVDEIIRGAIKNIIIEVEE